jgi:2-polyprenyl-3-methyl-5-hydroxy-6-metoxy-1,4-benzoquinol methylase
MTPSAHPRVLIYYEIKDYKRDCDALEKIFAKFNTGKPKSILDVGCGTGSHASILSDRGYTVTGIDISKVMVRKAMENAGKSRIKAEFFVQDMRKIRLNRKFDRVIMFEVFGHLLTYEDLANTLSGLNQHLNKDGLFIFDFWNSEGISKLARAFSEAHKIRCYTLAEVQKHLDNNGFSLLSAYDWKVEGKAELDTAAKKSFQILAVAKKVKAGHGSVV